MLWSKVSIIPNQKFWSKWSKRPTSSTTIEPFTVSGWKSLISIRTKLLHTLTTHGSSHQQLCKSASTIDTVDTVTDPNSELPINWMRWLERMTVHHSFFNLENSLELQASSSCRTQSQHSLCLSFRVRVTNNSKLVITSVSPLTGRWNKVFFWNVVGAGHRFCRKQSG